jgi:DNA repair protein RecN (Recombination protein N)
VTHLAQVAARADHQLRVVKDADAGRTRVDAQVLDNAARLDEIARMLGGKVSEQGRAHAAELMSAAGDS